MTVGQIAEGTIQVMGSQATETILGRIIATHGETVTIEGMITATRETPTAIPVEVEIPETIRLHSDFVTILS